MRIGIDTCCWGNRRGFGRFTRELLSALFEIDRTNNYFLFLDSETEAVEDLPDGPLKVIVKTSESQIEAASADGRRSISDILAMSRTVHKYDLDVFFFPTVYSYFPIFNRTKIVVGIHDMIASNHPELVFSTSRARHFWNWKQWLAVKQADVIATVSENSKREIMRHFGLPASRVRLITEGVRESFVVRSKENGLSATLKKYNISAETKIILYVGGISPHKNIGNLIEAFSIIRDSHQNVSSKLVLVGDHKDDPFLTEYPQLKRRVDEHRLYQDAIFTGYIPDDVLAYFYSRASVVVLPSFEEGFGLPAVEAMACGAPVAASNRGSLPEVLGRAGRFFEPDDPKDMATVIGKVIFDEELNDEMKAEGLRRSALFTWRQAAEDAIRIFNELNVSKNGH